MDRQGYFEDPSRNYAQRVNQFEQKVYNRFAGHLQKIGSSARQFTKRVRNAARRTGHRSLGVVRLGANSIARMAKATDRNLRGMARVATKGLRRISSKLGRAGTGGIERMGSTSANIGTAAVRGFVKVSKDYIKGFKRASANAFHGLKRVGKTYRRGISRVGNTVSGLATAYSRGVARMGTVPKNLGDVAADGVNRLGELASQTGQTIGDLATDVSDAAFSLPKSLSNVAKDKKMRDCMLQAMCYISTPFIDPNSNHVKRRRSTSDSRYNWELMCSRFFLKMRAGHFKHEKSPVHSGMFCMDLFCFGKKTADNMISQIFFTFWICPQIIQS